MCKFVDDVAYNAVPYLIADFAHCQTTVQECLERITGQGGSRGGSRSSPGSLLPGQWIQTPGRNTMYYFTYDTVD